jgi:hypothetical protein
MDRGRVGQSEDLPTGQTGFLRLPASLPPSRCAPDLAPLSPSAAKGKRQTRRHLLSELQEREEPQPGHEGAIALHASTQRKPLASGCNRASPGRWQDHFLVTVTNRGNSKPLTCRNIPRVELRGFEPRTSCMPCGSGQSILVGQGRTGSLPPALIVRGGRAPSEDAASRWLPQLAPGSSAGTGALQVRLDSTDDPMGLNGNGQEREEEFIR